MKRTVTLIVLIAFLLCMKLPVCAAACAADAEEQLKDYSERINERLDLAIDDDTKELMEENGVRDGSLSELTPERILMLIAEHIMDSATEPAKTFGRLAAVLILTSMVKSTVQGRLSGGITMVSTVAVITIIYRSVYDTFSGVCGFLDKLSAFMLSYIPIYASVNAASGSFTTGGSYYASTLGICELIGFASHNVIMPFLSLFMTLSFTAAINPDMHFSEAAASVKNAVKITLGTLMTIFTGSMTIRSITGAAADSAASRAVRFGVSSFVPIIGGSVSEAYSTVYAGVGIIRSAVGTIGIAAAGLMLLKPIVSLLLVKTVLGAAAFVSDMLGLSEPSELMKSTGYAMSAAISTVICFSMMFIISTSVVMLTAADCL